MRWRGRLVFLTLFTLFGAGAGAAQPYWDSLSRGEDTSRGRRGRLERTDDTTDKIWRRAGVGAAVGFGAALLASSGHRRRSRTAP